MDFRIIDITKDLVKTPPYPGDPVPELSVFSSVANGDGCNMARLTSTLHCGTHADAPLHFIPGGKTINAVPVDRFIGECRVIEVDTERITGDYVDKHFPKGCKSRCPCFLDFPAVRNICSVTKPLMDWIR